MPDLSPKPFVFVLMPFSPAFDDIYHLGIKPACDKADAYAERVDEQVFQGSILQRIYNQIAKADLVVADMSGRNPNVFYETGYAHALGKPVIHLSQSTDDIPFDLRAFPHIIYNRRLIDLIPALERWVRGSLACPRDSTPQCIRVFIDGSDLAKSSTVPVAVTAHTTGLSLKIDLHNDISHAVRGVSCQLGLIAPITFVGATFDTQHSITPFRLDNDQHLFLYEPRIEMLPAGWRRVAVHLQTQNRPLDGGERFDMSVRLFTSLGYADFGFTVPVEVTEPLPQLGPYNSG